MRRKKIYENLIITEKFKCKTCRTRFHLIQADYERMAKQALSVLCPRCRRVVVKGREMMKCVAKKKLNQK